MPLPQKTNPTPAPHNPGPRPELEEILPGHVELHGCAFALHTSSDGKVTLPEWVQLTPAGEDEGDGEAVVRGRDGRRFTIDDPKAVLEGTELPIQFDWEHLSVYPAVWGGSTRAAGWIDRIEFVEKGDEGRPTPGFWGHVERWTADGRADVEGGYYRGLSPLVRYQYREPAKEGDEAPPPLLRGFVNVALTNLPNLRMALLHSQGTPPRPAPAPAPPAPVLTPREHAVNALLAPVAEQIPVEHRYSARQLVLGAVERHELELVNVASFYVRCTSPEAMGAITRELAHRRRPSPRGPLPGPTPAPASSGLTAQQRQIAHALGLTEAEYAHGMESGPPSVPGLTASQRRVCRELGLTEAAFAAELGAEALDAQGHALGEPSPSPAGATHPAPAFGAAPVAPSNASIHGLAMARTWGTEAYDALPSTAAELADYGKADPAYAAIAAEVAAEERERELDEARREADQRSQAAWMAKHYAAAKPPPVVNASKPASERGR